MNRELKYIKLKNKEELFAYIEEDDSRRRGVKLIAPLVLFFDPTVGLVAKYWITFSDDRDAYVNDDDILVIAKANQKSVDYYEEFMRRMEESINESSYESATQTNTVGVDLDDMTEDELEDFLSSAFDVKSTKLH